MPVRASRPARPGPGPARFPRQAPSRLAFSALLLALLLWALAFATPVPAQSAGTGGDAEPSPGLAAAMDALLGGADGGRHGAGLGQRLPEALTDHLAALGDRSTGAPGAGRAADLMEAALRLALPDAAHPRFGRQSLAVPVPRSHGAALAVDGGASATVLPLRASALSPATLPPGGVNAPLLDAGRGTLADFRGLDPAGAVVLMDMDSGRGWQNAAMLGARALIYVQGSEAASPAPRSVFEDKFEPTPIDFPRFWLPREAARALFGPTGRPAPGAAPRVRLTARAAWENARADNVWALIPGTDPLREGELLVVEAFYDSTPLVDGLAPGADEAASAAALAALARDLGEHPPARSVLLVATAAHAQAQAGMRELVRALTAPQEELRGREARLAARAADARRALDLFGWFEPLRDNSSQYDAEDKRNLQRALGEVVKDRVDALSRRLMRLRLEGRGRPDSEAVREMAEERMRYRRLSWLGGLDVMDAGDRETLASLVPDAIAGQRQALGDAQAELDSARGALALREALGGRRVVASVSLHLSGGGRGVGAFERGWLYEYHADVNRARFYAELDDALKAAAATLPPAQRASFHDTLRPSPLDSWRGFLPDQPQLAGEVAALAGLRGLTLATVHDARGLWGTPFDLPERLDRRALAAQREMVTHLARALADGPLAPPGGEPVNGFTTLQGRANLMRQGEVFPDRPARGTVVLAFQGAARMYAMVDAAGRFSVPGLANYGLSPHKAVLESYRFDPDTGRAVWAVDKPLTGKDSYRVRMKRAVTHTDLVLFPCAQTTLFGLFDQRTFRPLAHPKLIDARTEAGPLRYWYSRLDTGASTIGTFFLQPDVPLKLTLSDTLLDKKLILLNADPEHPQGRGFTVDSTPLVPRTEYRAAADMWSLIGPRLSALEERGIVDERLRELHGRGRAELARADAARESLAWDEFMDASRASLALASQVYGAVDATQRDVLVGVLFYVALFVPFAYCLERLLFGFSDVRKRIGAFLGLLVAVIAAVGAVHPAFELTYSPTVVILAFFILGLSVLVSLIILMRFEREMVELQRRSRHLRATGISRAAAFGAAFALGVSNLRRRPVRTALTCLTLTILTFTVMNFTAVRSADVRGWARFGPQAPYHGLLMKNPGWRDLPEEALAVVRGAFGPGAVAAPRVWYDSGDPTRPPAVPVRRGQEQAVAQGIVGLSAAEPRVSGLDRALSAGRWFAPGEPYAVLLPQAMAEALGVVPGDPERGAVDIWGLRFAVTGVLRQGGLADAPDLDGEPVTPIFYPSEAATRLSEAEAEALEEGQDVLEHQSRYQHVNGDRTLIVPARTLLALGGGGGRLKAVALAGPGADAPGRDLAGRFGLMLFRGGPDGTALHFAAGGTSYSGVANVAVPLAISVLIVLNTMIGSVHERRREIAVYTSVGLAPSHVAFLFVAEALAFGVISVVAGYLLAQTSAGLLAGTPLWAGMTANYSSTAGVAAMALVMGVVLVSAIYPARMAAAIAIPDVNRSWTMPEARGDVLELALPFLVGVQEQASAGGFLQRYYDAHQDVSHGLFCTDAMQCDYRTPGDLARGGLDDVDQDRGAMCLGLDLRVWLAPFDFGVRQRVALHFCPSLSYPGFMRIRMVLTREAGERTAWQRANRRFVNDLRKQLLVWRSLDDETAGRYGRELQITSAEPLRPGEAAA